MEVLSHSANLEDDLEANSIMEDDDDDIVDDDDDIDEPLLPPDTITNSINVH